MVRPSLERFPPRCNEWNNTAPVTQWISTSLPSMIPYSTAKSPVVQTAGFVCGMKGVDCEGAGGCYLAGAEIKLSAQSTKQPNPWRLPCQDLKCQGSPERTAFRHTLGVIFISQWQRFSCAMQLTVSIGRLFAYGARPPGFGTGWIHSRRH